MNLTPLFLFLLFLVQGVWATDYYIATDVNKRCAGYLNLGEDKDLSTGQFEYQVPANGAFRIGLGTIS